LGKRRWASQHWICCELHYKNWHHEPMGEGYTSLFFLDEVTALAAGHRPCFMCRNKEAKAFLKGRKVDEFDRALHAERLTRHEANASLLPDGAMVELEGAYHAIRRDQLLRWSHAGYVAAARMPAAATVRLLTPPLIVQILQQGYEPRWHPSALQWETS
jgi:methylphosphotriester-DNA--protein-cysteine methyltransferase